MLVRELPARPDLEHFKKQARTLLQQVLLSDASATGRFAAFDATTTKPALADALYVIAREYGFDTWSSLKLHIDGTPKRSVVLEEIDRVFAGIKSRLEQLPSAQEGLICKHGISMDSVVLKLQKASWTNDPMNQLRNKTGIFFSVWIDEESVARSRAYYNIHALKLRHLKGYAITSRAFAGDFRDKFALHEEDWPNVDVKHGPLTLMQGWIEISADTPADDIYPLMRRFEQLCPLIDRLLEARRR